MKVEKNRAQQLRIRVAGTAQATRPDINQVLTEPARGCLYGD